MARNVLAVCLGGVGFTITYWGGGAGREMERGLQETLLNPLQLSFLDDVKFRLQL